MLKNTHFPHYNPLFIAPPLKQTYVTISSNQRIVKHETGEIVLAKDIYQEARLVDTEPFLKTYEYFLDATEHLSSRAMKVFRDVCKIYLQMPYGGNMQTVNLRWTTGYMGERKVNYSKPTYYRGMNELVAKGIIAKKGQGFFWINPNLMYRGKREDLVKEVSLQLAKCKGESFLYLMPAEEVQLEHLNNGEPSR